MHMHSMFYACIALCGIGLALALCKGFLNTGERWEHGERWEIPKGRR